MKKQGSKKLKLRTETLRGLQDGDLTVIAGATMGGCVSRLLKCEFTAQEGCGNSEELCS